jgi:choline kinase
LKGIILAAGRGSRMKTLTDERPKCLVELDGRTLLDYQINALSDAGIDEIAIVTGYRRELLAPRFNVEFHNPRWAETNMVSSLSMAQEWLEAEICIVSYSDIFYTSDAPRKLMQTEASLAITFDPNWHRLWAARFDDPLLDAETFRLGVDDCLTEIGKRPTTVTEVEGQYMGLLRFESSGWQEMERIRSEMEPAARDRLDMTSALQKVIERGRVQVRGVRYTGPWGEIDSEQDLRLYEGQSQRNIG